MTFEELKTEIIFQNRSKVTADSRLVEQGGTFVAIRGSHNDGRSFIAQAIENGAKYIVAESRPENIPLKKPIEFIIVESAPRAAGILAQGQFQNPADKLTNLAVTGTNGKTTVAFIVRSIINNASEKCGLISTVLYDTTEKIIDSRLTTPGQFTIAELMQQMVKAGAKFMVTEASSHALDQDRLWGVKFKAAAFTNLSGDHLDYHKTSEKYLAAKTKVFSSLSEDSFAILNKQSVHSAQIAGETKAEILWYAIDEDADIRADIKSMDITGTEFRIEYKGLSRDVKTALVGRYNISNCLAAAGLCIAARFDLEAIAAGIESLKSIPGRLQKIEQTGDFTVLVDYAHTDDALKNVLETLKPLCKGRLIVVFGCGGDRDRSKRPRMAKVVQKYADMIIVTSDNPRSENPDEIISDIIGGFERADTEDIKIEPDRRKAIGLAIDNAGKDDIVVIAGKGHENYQILADRTIDFSDKETAKKILREKIDKIFSK